MQNGVVLRQTWCDETSGEELVRWKQREEEGLTENENTEEVVSESESVVHIAY